MERIIVFKAAFSENEDNERYGSPHLVPRETHEDQELLCAPY